MLANIKNVSRAHISLFFFSFFFYNYALLNQHMRRIITGGTLAPLSLLASNTVILSLIYNCIWTKHITQSQIVPVFFAEPSAFNHYSVPTLIELLHLKRFTPLDEVERYPDPKKK